MATKDALCLAPYLDRLNYFYGQMLGVRDFQTEQDYFREKIKLHNRCLHGYGVVCGLKVELTKPHDPAAPATPAYAPGQQPPAKDMCWPELAVACGLALDAAGNELIVHSPLCVDLHQCFPSQQLDDIAKYPASKPVTCWLSLSFRAIPMEPVRPVVVEGCGDSRSCQFGKLRDSVCVNITLDKPADHYDCNPCCEPNPALGSDEHCCDTGPPILLAKITFSRDGSHETEIDNSPRVRVQHHATTIADINWVHGGHYDTNQASRLIKQGLRVRFSREIRPETIQPGIVDVFLLTGGGSIRGDVKYLDGKVEVYPKQGKALGLIYDFKDSRYEHLSPGDRLHIVVRSAFILDQCCQPIDGLHVGGWVPLANDQPANEHPHPAQPPKDCGTIRGTYGRWESGTGAPGGNFESWLTVIEPKDGGKK